MSDTEDDFLPAPLKFKSRTQKILTGEARLIVNEEGQLEEADLSLDIKIQQPNSPAPVFHDTPDNNIIDNDLDIVTTNVKNLVHLWPAVRTIADACLLADRINKGLMERRKLANKQLGTKEGSGGGNIFTIKE